MEEIIGPVMRKMKMYYLQSTKKEIYHIQLNEGV